jgi:hypothetical protein
MELELTTVRSGVPNLFGLLNFIPVSVFILFAYILHKFILLAFNISDDVWNIFISDSVVEFVSIITELIKKVLVFWI